MDEAPIMFGRSELIALRERALALAETPGLNPTWQRALFALADAANALDAMQARLEVDGAGSV